MHANLQATMLLKVTNQNKVGKENQEHLITSTGYRKTNARGTVGQRYAKENARDPLKEEGCMQ